MSDAIKSLVGLSAIAKAAGIKKVYWIDDQFCPVGTQMVEAIRAKIYGLREADIEPQHPVFKGVSFTGIPDADGTKIEALLKAGPSGMGHEILAALDVQMGEVTHQKPAFTDLTAEQIAVIAASLGPVQKMCFADWRKKQADLLATENDGVLFLIDHDFSLEEGCTQRQGEDILKPLVSDAKQRCFCILFTHGTGVEKEHGKREELVKAMGNLNPPHRFSVVSKENITIPAEKGEEPLARAFQDVFVREWCHMMIESTQKVFVSALEDTKKDFASLTFDEIAVAFFRRSADDGISEFEVLARVMMLAGRVALEDSKKAHGDLWSKLARVRAVLGAGNFMPHKQRALTGGLATLRAREIWDPPEYVNSMHTPPSCGDVYEHTKNGMKYVLVGQPCHLAIRSNGARDHSEALWLQVESRAPADGKGYRYDFPDGPQWIHFVRAYPVNLYLLDLASFNSEGLLTLKAADVTPDLLLPGVREHCEKFKRAISGFQPKVGLKARYKRLSVNEDLHKGELKVEGGGVALPFRRIGRIRSPHAEAILGGLAVCHTRMAFDYDFSKQNDLPVKAGPEKVAILPNEVTKGTDASAAAPTLVAFREAEG